jgi:hypothetical protein
MASELYVYHSCTKLTLTLYVQFKEFYIVWDVVDVFVNFLPQTIYPPLGAGGAAPGARGGGPTV